MASEPAAYLRVRVRDLFPPNDSIVPPLLRLMPAVNDLRTLQKMWFSAHTRVGNTPSERDIIRAEDRYLFRLTCGTAFEAARAFQDLRQALEVPAAQGTIERMPGEARAAFRALASIFPEDFENRDYGKILARTRHSIFHYPETKLIRPALQQHDEVGRLIVGNVVGASRYLLADDLQVQILARLLGGPFEDQLGNLMRLILEVARYFGELVDGMVWMYIRAHEEAIVEQCDDTVDLERLWNIAPECAQRGLGSG